MGIVGNDLQLWAIICHGGESFPTVENHFSRWDFLLAWPPDQSTREAACGRPQKKGAAFARPSFVVILMGGCLVISLGGNPAMENDFPW